MKYLTLAQRMAIVLPEDIKGIIAGMLLGDSCLHKNKKWPNTNASLHVEQKDEGFVQLLWEKMNSIGIVRANPKTRNRLDKRTGNTYTSTVFATISLPFFTCLFNQWYKAINGKNIKVLPNNIADLLTPITLAFWCASACNLL